MSKQFFLFSRLKNIELIEEDQLDEVSKELQQKVATEREKRANTAILKLAKTRYMAKKREEKEKQNEEFEDNALFVESNLYGIGIVKDIHEGETPEDSYATVVFEHGEEIVFLEDLEKMLGEMAVKEEAEVSLEERKHDTGWYKSSGPRKDAYGNVIKRKNTAKHLAKQGAAEAEDGKDHSDGEPDDAVNTRKRLGKAHSLATKAMKANEETQLDEISAGLAIGALRARSKKTDAAMDTFEKAYDKVGSSGSSAEVRKASDKVADSNKKEDKIYGHIYKRHGPGVAGKAYEETESVDSKLIDATSAYISDSLKRKRNF